MWIGLLLALGDLLATVLVYALSIGLRESLLPAVLPIDPFSPVRTYASLWPALVLSVVVRAGWGLYPGYAMSAPEGLRRQSLATLVLVGFVIAGGALFRFGGDYSRLVLATTGLFMLVLLPLVRTGVKALLTGTAGFGERVWLVGCGSRAAHLKETLARNPQFGLRIVGATDDIPDLDVPADTCLVIPDGIRHRTLPDLLDTLNDRFRRVLLAPNLLDIASVWITPRDLQGHLALELRNNLLETRNRWLKRSFDLAAVAALLPLVLPLSLLIAIVIPLDSRGPVLIRQRRVGQGGRPITVLKFRTMHPEAQTLLEEHLADHPDARREWQQTRKLRNDPRVTRFGRLLRPLSLDELPQLWNVLRGEMSLVGPRPVMDDELGWYGSCAHLYTRVPPGLTGLWQVSGRNDLSYEERTRLDAYYVRNWSLWLDIHIMARTPAAVFGSRGAY